jgi:hypothetical protein
MNTKVDGKDVKISDFTEQLKVESVDKTDYFRHIDERLNKELSTFYEVTQPLADRSNLLSLRDEALDHRQEHLQATLNLKGYLAEKIGFEEPSFENKDALPVEIEMGTSTKLLHSIDAMIYKDLTENKGQEYDNLIQKRDAFTQSKENFESSLEAVVEKTRKLDPRLQNEKTAKVVSLVKRTIKQGGKEKQEAVER